VKKLADLLTGLRFILAALIAYTAWTSAPEGAIGTMVLLTLLAWTSDVLDGPLARAAPDHRPTWLGTHDLEVDLSLALALAGALAAWRGAPAALIAGVIVAGAIGWLAFRSLAPVNLGMGLIYGLFMLMAWRADPMLGGIMLAWILAAALVFQARARAQVAGFLRACRDIVAGLSHSTPGSRGAH
jgi:phosphatidylglycerophosphate synthase